MNDNNNGDIYRISPELGQYAIFSSFCGIKDLLRYDCF